MTEVTVVNYLYTFYFIWHSFEPSVGVNQRYLQYFLDFCSGEAISTYLNFSNLRCCINSHNHKNEAFNKINLHAGRFLHN